MKAKSEEKEGVAFRIDGVMTFYIKYFDNCFKEIIKQDDFRWSYVGKKVLNIKKTVLTVLLRTMLTTKKYCNKKQIEGNINWLKIYGYSLANPLRHWNYQRNV